MGCALAGVAIMAGLLKVVGAAEPAHESGEPSPAPTEAAMEIIERPEPRSLDKGTLTRALDRLVKRSGGRLSLSVRDLDSGTEYSYGTSRRHVTASIVKVDILAALLLRAQRAGRRLTAYERSLADRMIRSSDNDAADILWEEIGGASGLAEANRRLGLRETRPTDVSWGLTSTSARDQVRLLAALNSGDSPLNESSRGYVEELMTSVVGGQDWGVGSADGAEEVALKNGWLPRSADGGRWVVNSIGRVEGDRDYLVAVLSDRHSSMAPGVELIEDATDTVLQALAEV